MIRRMFRRCGNAPGALASEDQAVVDAFRALLAAHANPQPWTPGCGHDAAVRVGPFIERAQPRPGDDHGPGLIAVTLAHPDSSYAAAYLPGHQLGYTGRGWLRCETAAILGVWQPAYAMLTHAASDLPLPDDVGMPRRFTASTLKPAGRTTQATCCSASAPTRRPGTPTGTSTASTPNWKARQT